MSRKTFNKNTTKKIFAGLVIAQTGDFGPSRTHDKIEGWILSAGGTLARTLARTIGADITHLLCTEEDWKKKVAKVKQTLIFQHAYVVTIDWLEQCLLAKTPRRLKERPFELSTLDRAARKKKCALLKAQKQISAASTFPQPFPTALLNVLLTAVAGIGESFVRGSTAADEILSTKLYHVYRDYTFFEYDVVLRRMGRDRAGRQVLEKYRLVLWESHARPSLYAASVTFQVGGGRKILHQLVPIANFFEPTLAAFQKFFKQRTGRSWYERITAQPQTLVVLPFSQVSQVGEQDVKGGSQSQSWGQQQSQSQESGKGRGRGKPLQQASTLSNAVNAAHNAGCKALLDQKISELLPSLPDMVAGEFFVYDPPKLGRPVGIMPYGWVDPRLIEEEVAISQDGEDDRIGDAEEVEGGQEDDDDDNDDNEDDDNSSKEFTMEIDSDTGSIKESTKCANGTDDKESGDEQSDDGVVEEDVVEASQCDGDSDVASNGENNDDNGEDEEETDGTATSCSTSQTERRHSPTTQSTKLEFL